MLPHSKCPKSSLQRLHTLTGSMLQRLFEIVDRLFDSLLERHARLPAENFFSREIFGWRTLGSSTGNGLYSIADFVPVMRMISSANCLIVISRGFPRLTGS